MNVEIKLVYLELSKLFQIEDLSQQAQVAAAEKFKAPEVAQAAEAGGSTTVCLNSCVL